jgi:hypothetical protein
VRKRERVKKVRERNKKGERVIKKENVGDIKRGIERLANQQKPLEGVSSF